MKRIALSAALASLALAACGSDDGVTDEAREEAPGETGVAVDNIADEKAVGADAAVPLLEPLGDEQSVDLGPTLGACSFEHEGDLLFIAGAPDESNARGNGVIQVAGRDRLLAGADMNGPEGINDGPTMTDGEYTVTIERGAGDGEVLGIESTRWPAELIVRKDMANEVRYAPGTWTCGV